ncbi:diguanylate cyclase (GGDEF) domain-containing protein [Granulicella pectinivorans]|uniref:diguanylate cyclase n=1 Tax=Granulicella pectinivorans TaxID=474950 RepID=A0A1I6MFP3_9BACT|nr:GGDEF domain-containing protein [Granulicella pectinivorans]SFS14545.1 diguanylate cyclase (GGDEF) domain-containing protein [Granulicella pectinivorans]
MAIIERLDNWTLFLCIALSTSMSAFAFARIWRTNRTVRGAGHFALAFLFGTAGCFFIAFLPDNTPLFHLAGNVIEDTLVRAVYALLLIGVDRFFGVRRASRFAWPIVAIALVLTVFFTLIIDSNRVNLIITDLVTFFFRISIAIELLRHTGRRHLRPLSALMFVFALLSLEATWDSIAHPVSTIVLDTKGQQSLALFTTLFFFIATGQLLLLILNGDLVRQLQDEATRDFLTSALNRRGAERILAAEIDRAHRFRIPLAVALVDIDRFKEINDTLGHAEGDKTIVAVARTIDRNLRTYDSVGRFGGDEFLVVLPNTPTQEGLQVLERLRREVEETTPPATTLSIGLTTLSHADTLLSLLARADEALYKAKAEGRNRITVRPSAEIEAAVLDPSHTI